MTASHHQGLINRLNLIKEQGIKHGHYFFANYKELVEPIAPDLAKHLPEPHVYISGI